jgi:hypothetical protein
MKNVLTNEINTLAGYPIEFEVNWDTLALIDTQELFFYIAEHFPDSALQMPDSIRSNPYYL